MAESQNFKELLLLLNDCQCAMGLPACRRWLRRNAILGAPVHQGPRPPKIVPLAFAML